MIDDESLKNIERLHQLKTDGVITEEEFEKAKEKLLFGSKPQTRATSQPRTAAQTIITPEANAELQWALLPLKRYADFTGRSSRKEFWMFMLLITVVIIILAIGVAFTTDPYGEASSLGTMMYGLIGLTFLGSFIPLIAVSVRRFHDQDKSGWFALFYLIPYVGSFIVLIFMLFDGTPGDNRYGPDPKLG